MSVLFDRLQEDAQAGEQIGVAATNSPGSCTLLIDGVKNHFQACLDVPIVGVLCALPAILANGLLSGIDGACKVIFQTKKPAIVSGLCKSDSTKS